MGSLMRLLRRSEWLLVVYFLYTSLLALLLPLRSPIPVVTCTLNLSVIGGFFLLAYADSLRRRQFLSIVRDWYPAPLMLLAYREMGWFAPTRHDYRLEQSWIIWDRILLNDLGLRAAIESLGPVIPSILELSYSLVYTMATFSVAMLYAYHKRERVDRFLTIFLFGILTAYALFPCFPSEPPRAVFPNEDLPGVLTPFRRFNLALLGGYGIHTSVFPSAHVSGAFSAAFAMFGILPEKRWVASVLLVLAVLITTATIYGRYHYAVDALAGFAISMVAVFAGRALFPPAAR